MLSKLKDAGVRIAVKGPRYLKALVCEPRWAATFLFGRFYCLRQLSRWLSVESKKIQTARSRLFADLDPSAVVSSLQQDGMTAVFQLPPETVAGIHQYAANAPAVANEDPSLSFVMSKKDEAEAKLGKPVIVASYPEIQKSLDVKSLLNDPLLNDVAAQYIGSDVKASARMWWSFPVAATREDRLRFAQGTFHYDPDVDFRALKYFFCLTDTDENSGAHECVIGSHRRKGLRHLFTLFVGQSDQEIERFYGRHNIRKMNCAAGQGFAEDPLCFHKGNAPTENPRLMLELLFVPERGVQQAPSTAPAPATDPTATERWVTWFKRDRRVESR